MNLLPKNKKQELSLRKLNRQIIILGCFAVSAIIGILICLNLIYLSLYISQQQTSQNNALFNQAQELETQVEDLNQELTGFINQRLAFINKINQEKIYWAQILEKLSRIIPKNIKLTSLETSDKIQIAGTAKTRDDVLLLQKALEQEKQFIELESPLSNFVKQSNVDFYFAFKIKHAD